VSTTAAPVEDSAACPAYTACGGDPDGAFDYSKGCVGDIFADARTQCPTLDTTGLTTTVTGTIYFIGGNALHRNVRLDISGTVVIPASCAAGQCTTVQTELTNAGVKATCTGSAECTCTVTQNETRTDATTYTKSGNTVTTADGDSYEICLQGSKLTYKGASAQAEDGTWELTKR
jgi:hypothetical protein